MSKDRYQSLFRFLRFDNTETKQNRVSAMKEKLEAFHSIFDQFSQGCTENYSSDCNLTADKRLATGEEAIYGVHNKQAMMVWFESTDL